MSRQENKKTGLFGVYIELAEHPTPEKPVVLAVSKTSRYYPTTELIQRFVTKKIKDSDVTLAPVPFVTAIGKPLVKIFIPDGSMQANNCMPEDINPTIFNFKTSVGEYYEKICEELKSGITASNAWGDELSAQLIEDLKKVLQTKFPKWELSAISTLANSMIIRWSDLEKAHSIRAQGLLMKYINLYKKGEDFATAVNNTTDNFLTVPGRNSSDSKMEYSHRYLIYEAAAIRLLCDLKLTNSLSYQSKATPLIKYVIDDISSFENPFHFSFPEPLLTNEQLQRLADSHDKIYKDSARNLRRYLAEYEKQERQSLAEDHYQFPLAAIEKENFQRLLDFVVQFRESFSSHNIDYRLADSGIYHDFTNENSSPITSCKTDKKGVAKPSSFSNSRGDDAKKDYTRVLVDEVVGEVEHVLRHLVQQLLAERCATTSVEVSNTVLGSSVNFFTKTSERRRNASAASSDSVDATTEDAQVFSLKGCTSKKY